MPRARCPLKAACHIDAPPVQALLYQEVHQDSPGWSDKLPQLPCPLFVTPQKVPLLKPGSGTNYTPPPLATAIISQSQEAPQPPEKLCARSSPQSQPAFVKNLFHLIRENALKPEKALP